MYNDVAKTNILIVVKILKDCAMNNIIVILFNEPTNQNWSDVQKGYV